MHATWLLRAESVVSSALVGFDLDRSRGKPDTIKDPSRRCQRKDRSAEVASSTYYNRSARKERRQWSTEGESRGLALPAGRHGQPLEVIGPFAQMRLVSHPEWADFYSATTLKAGRRRSLGFLVFGAAKI